MSDPHSRTLMYGSTWGLRYYEGHFHVHLMWMHWKTGQWISSRSMVRAKYKTLERALKAFDTEYASKSVVMIFPV